MAQRQRGFSFIEIAVLVAILGLLMVVAMPAEYHNYKQEHKDKNAQLGDALDVNTIQIYARDRSKPTFDVIFLENKGSMFQGESCKASEGEYRKIKVVNSYVEVQFRRDVVPDGWCQSGRIALTREQWEILFLTTKGQNPEQVARKAAGAKYLEQHPELKPLLEE